MAKCIVLEVHGPFYVQFWKTKPCIYELLHFCCRRFYPIFMILGLINVIRVKHKMSSTSFSTFTGISSVFIIFFWEHGYSND